LFSGFFFVAEGIILNLRENTIKSMKQKAEKDQSEMDHLKVENEGLKNELSSFKADVERLEALCRKKDELLLHMKRESEVEASDKNDAVLPKKSKLVHERFSSAHFFSHSIFKAAMKTTRAPAVPIVEEEILRPSVPTTPVKSPITSPVKKRKQTSEEEEETPEDVRPSKTIKRSPPTKVELTPIANSQEKRRTRGKKLFAGKNRKKMIWLKLALTHLCSKSCVFGI
jgi:hypothetical protein